MNTERIRKLLVIRDEAAKDLAALRNEFSTLTLNGHQEEIIVFVGKGRRPVSVAKIGGSDVGYSSILLRGREMVLLGVKKAFAEMVKSAEERLAKIDSDISGEVTE